MRTNVTKELGHEDSKPILNFISDNWMISGCEIQIRIPIIGSIRKQFGTRTHFMITSSNKLIKSMKNVTSKISFDRTFQYFKPCN